MSFFRDIIQKHCSEEVFRNLDALTVEAVGAAITAADCVIVPRDPTPEMLAAPILKAHESAPIRNERDRRYADYCAMIDARPL